ncbi:MAG: AEC family transporter [Clostridia bacterium]|nr:AEC family transporter [Clostridia bacterium]
MDSLIFAINAVAPIIAMVAIGYILKKIGFMTPDFAKAANKLVFRLFLPCMLFLNVYRIEDLGGMDFGYVIYVLLAVLVIFLVALPLILAVTKPAARRGALLQSIFRSNYALIGIPLSEALFGAEGAAVATLLSTVTIPSFNILAVISLSIFQQNGGKPSVKKILLGIIKNPLIQAVFVGLAAVGVRAVLTHFGVGFRLSDIDSLFKVLTYLSNMATPLALLVLGAQFEFSAVTSLKKEIVFGTLMRTVAVPVFGLGAAYALMKLGVLDVTGAHFASFVAVFGTPVAVSSVPMAQEMDSDATLAGQLVVWTTAVSAFTVFLAAFILRLVGVFA